MLPDRLQSQLALLLWSKAVPENLSFCGALSVDVISAGLANNFRPHLHRVPLEICSGEHGDDWELCVYVYT